MAVRDFRSPEDRAGFLLDVAVSLEAAVASRVVTHGDAEAGDNRGSAEAGLAEETGASSQPVAITAEDGEAGEGGGRQCRTLGSMSWAHL